jgi:SAM-dependent methyltransferase
MDPDVIAHYSLGVEAERLGGGSSRIEFERTKELLLRFLPEPPARILDVGGGPGWYASWLAGLGHDVRSIDVVPLHVEQAKQRSEAGPHFEVELGDARQLSVADESVDVVLLLGPLYHLPSRDDRIEALNEARRVTRSGGLVVIATISRFAGLLDGMRSGSLTDPDLVEMGRRELETGVHVNTTGRPEYFTTAYFHRPEEIPGEVAEAGLQLERIFGIEGPGWLIWERWDDPDHREGILIAARTLEAEPSVTGMSAHLLTFALHPQPG